MKRSALTTILIPFVYFITGATGLAGVATTFFYKQDLALTIEQTQILASIAVIPWSIKPLYGFFSDRMPVFGMHRKPYLILAGILGSAGYLSMAIWVDSFYGALVATLLSGLGFAIADVIVDGIVVERSRSHRAAGKLQSICRAAIMAGALIVAYASGVLMEAIGARPVFMITGFLPLLIILFAVFLVETPADVPSFSLRDTFTKLRSALSPAILWSIAFLFVWRATPSSGSALNYYMIDELQFNAEFFGRLAFISYGMGIVGVIIFRTALLRVPLKKLLVGIIFASVILSLPTLGLVYGWYTYVGISPQLFAMADTLITGPLTEIAFLPLLILAARICPKGIEATMFALLASIMNIGYALSDMGGAFLVNIFDVRQATETLAANYEHLDKVLWIAILSSLLPLPLIPFLPDTRAEDEFDSGEVLPSGMVPEAVQMEGKSGEIA